MQQSSRIPYFLSLAVLIPSLVLATFVPNTAYCDEGVKMKETAVWPSEIDGWKISEGPDAYDPNTAFKYMNGAAELFLAYNMMKLTVLRYEKPGRPSITAEIFRMASPEDAYGIFSFESDDPGAGIGQGSEFGGGLLRFWKGYYFVSTYGESSGADVEAATLHLGQHIALFIQETGAQPKILSYPPDGEAPFTKNQTWFIRSHILLNQRFFIAHNNVLNLANDVEVALARYGTGKNRVHLLLIQYPAQMQANSAFTSFMGTYMHDASGKALVKTENNRWTAMEKHESFIIIVFDAPDQAFAWNMIRATAARLPKEGK